MWKNFIRSIDYRALEIFSSFDTNDLEKNLIEFRDFLDALIRIQQSVVDAKGNYPRWKVYSDSLITKIILHGNAIDSLSTGTQLKSKRLRKEIRILNIPSILVMLRALLESFLMFDFIYIQPNTDKEKEFRVDNWIFEDYVQSQKIPTVLEASNTKKTKNLQYISEYQQKIEGSIYFQDFTEKQKKTLLKNGSSKLFNHWWVLITLSKIHPNIYNFVYKISSNYAHSGAHSIFNISKLGFKYKKEHELGCMILAVSKMLISETVLRYKTLFKAAEICYNMIEIGLQQKITFYSDMNKKRIQ